MSRRVTISLIWIFSIFSMGYAQIAKIDSLQIKAMMEDLKDKPHNEENYGKTQQIEQLSKQIKYVKGEIFALNHMGQHHTDMGEYEKAIALHQKAYQIGEKISDKKSLARAYYGLGNAYNFMNELDLASEYFDKSLNISRTVNDTAYVGVTLNSMGVIQIKRGNPKAGLEQLLEAKAIFETLGLQEKVVSLLNNIGIGYVQTGKTAQSIPYFKENLQYVQQRKDTAHLAGAYGNIAYAYQNIGDFQKAFMYYDTSLFYSEGLEQDAITYITYLDMSDGYGLAGDTKNALEYYKKYHQLQQKVLDYQTKSRVDELEVKFNTEKKEKELLATQKEVDNLELGRQRMWLLIGGLGAGLIIALLIFFKARGDAKRKQELQKVQQQLIQSELKNKKLEAHQLKVKLENKQSDLTNLALDIGRKNKFSNQLIERLEALQKVKPAHLKPKLREVISFAVHHLQINEDLALLQNNVDKINHAFYQKLDTQFGGLSSNEKYLAGLIRLNLSNKDIAALKGISTSSAKMARYRLRKKLGIGAEVDIVSFLQEV